MLGRVLGWRGLGKREVCVRWACVYLEVISSPHVSLIYRIGCLSGKEQQPTLSRAPRLNLLPSSSCSTTITRCRDPSGSAPLRYSRMCGTNDASCLSREPSPGSRNGTTTARLRIAGAVGDSRTVSREESVLVSGGGGTALGDSSLLTILHSSDLTAWRGRRGVEPRFFTKSAGKEGPSWVVLTTGLASSAPLRQLPVESSWALPNSTGGKLGGLATSGARASAPRPCSARTATP